MMAEVDLGSLSDALWKAAGRPLVLSKATDLEIFCATLEAHPGFAPPGAIREGIEGLLRHLPVTSWMVLHPALVGFSIPTGPKNSFNLDLLDAARLGQQLEALSGQANFNAHVEAYRNLGGFSDYRFESECAYFCLRLPNVRTLTFSPEVTVKGNVKRPDLLLETDGVPIVYCECKNVHRHEVNYLKACDSFIGLLDDELVDIVPESKRVTVDLLAPPQQPPRKTASEIAKKAQELISDDAVCWSDSRYQVTVDVRAKTPNWEKNAAPIGIRVKVGSTVAVPIEVTSSHLAVRGTYLLGKIARRTALLIKEARSQLPTGQNWTIFLQTYTSMRTMVTKTCEESLSGPEYADCLCYGVWSGNSTFTYRIADQEKVAATFGPFSNET